MESVQTDNGDFRQTTDGLISKLKSIYGCGITGATADALEMLSLRFQEVVQLIPRDSSQADAYEREEMAARISLLVSSIRNFVSYYRKLDLTEAYWPNEVVETKKPAAHVVLQTRRMYIKLGLVVKDLVDNK